MAGGVAAPRWESPRQLRYPYVGDFLIAGVEVLLEPFIDGCATNWAVEPSLPAGLRFESTTGKISGAPENAAARVLYVVSAWNDAGAVATLLEFSVAEDKLAALARSAASGRTPSESESQGFRRSWRPAELELDLGDGGSDAGWQQTADEIKTGRPGERDWMIWMVHRVFQNDPSLTDLDFSNLAMPPPYIEPRLAPKLCRALAGNTHLVSLQLAHSNLQKPQGYELAASLRTNTTLRVLNVESNSLDSDTIRAMADALGQNSESVLEQWRFTNQYDSGASFGRPTEKAIAEMMQRNTRIFKLGFACSDPHWRMVVDRAILRNTAQRHQLRRNNIGYKLADHEGADDVSQVSRGVCLLRLAPHDGAHGGA